MVSSACLFLALGSAALFSSRLPALFHAATSFSSLPSSFLPPLQQAICSSSSFVNHQPHQLVGHHHLPLSPSASSKHWQQIFIVSAFTLPCRRCPSAFNSSPSSNCSFSVSLDHDSFFFLFLHQQPYCHASLLFPVSSISFVGFFCPPSSQTAGQLQPSSCSRRRFQFVVNPLPPAVHRFWSSSSSMHVHGFTSTFTAAAVVLLFCSASHHHRPTAFAVAAQLLQSSPSPLLTACTSISVTVDISGSSSAPVRLASNRRLLSGSR